MFVIKQYGAQRTGTNVLRAMLEGSRADVRVLMHTLGDKHGPPSRLARGYATDADAVQQVLDATAELPSATTDLSSAEQRAFIEQIAAPVLAAIRARELRVVVSLRHPESWLAGRLRLRGRLRCKTNDRGLLASLEHDCRSFNLRYAAWFQLVAAMPGRASVVPIEVLAHDPLACWRSLCAAIGLDAPDVSLPATVALPAAWDHVPTPLHFEPQDVSRLEREVHELDPRVRAIAAHAIDWDALRPFGYRSTLL